MSKIILDPDLKARLNGLDRQLEFCDADGRTLGHYVPADEYRKMMYALAEAACPYSQDELRRMREEKGGVPLAEIWKKLGQA
jgi:hypothetical protein